MDTILILGASSDISIALARKFASNSYNVQLAARNTELLKPIQSDIQIRYQTGCSLHSFDACAFSSHKPFFESLPQKPDLVVCVFGVMEEEQKAFEDFETCHRMIDTNYTGAVSVLNVVAGYYAGQKKGMIVGVSSVAGERGRQSKLIYGSTKAAFTAYLDGLRNKLFKEGVHVMTVKPGFVYTKMTENLQLPGLLTASPELVADRVYAAVQKRTNTLYVKWMWRWIMLIIKLIPEFQFKKMNI